MEMKLDKEESKRVLEATCPDCRGPLTETDYGGLREYSCLVGHRYSAAALLRAHSETQERSLWSAVVALEESANLVKDLVGDFPDHVAQRLRDQAAAKLEQAAQIRRILERLEPFETGD